MHPKCYHIDLWNGIGTYFLHNRIWGTVFTFLLCSLSLGRGTLRICATWHLTKHKEICDIWKSDWYRMDKCMDINFAWFQLPVLIGKIYNTVKFKGFCSCRRVSAPQIWRMLRKPTRAEDGLLGIFHLTNVIKNIFGKTKQDVFKNFQQLRPPVM